MKPFSYHLPTLLTMKYCKTWIQHYTAGLLTLHATFSVMQEVHSPVKSILTRLDQLPLSINSSQHFVILSTFYLIW